MCAHAHLAAKKFPQNLPLGLPSGIFFSSCYKRRQLEASLEDAAGTASTPYEEGSYRTVDLQEKQKEKLTAKEYECREINIRRIAACSSRVNCELPKLYSSVR